MKKVVLLIILFFITINVYATNTSTIVMDVDSERILYQNNAYEKKLIASTTKIMTFIVAYEYGRDYLDLEIEVGDEILKMYGTSIYLSLHERMTLRDLLYGLMLRSGNDASVVIANFIGGSIDGFVKLMNLKAEKIGMNNTVFNNPHGLDEETQNYSTAYDMALLSIYANKIPFYQEVTSTKKYKVSTDIKSYSWTNRNKLVFTNSYFISGKTGYTPSAGKTFVSTCKKDNLTLTIVSLNDNNIYDNHTMLYNEYFNEFKNVKIVDHNLFPINDELNDSLVYLKNDIYYPLKKEEKDKIQIKVIVDNQNNGYVNAYLDDKVIGTSKIYKREKEEKKESLWQKIISFFK